MGAGEGGDGRYKMSFSGLKNTPELGEDELVNIRWLALKASERAMARDSRHVLTRVGCGVGS